MESITSKSPHGSGTLDELDGMPRPAQTEEMRQDLLNDIIEEAAGVFGLDLLLNPLVGGEVGDVGLISRACAAGEDSEDVTIPGKDNRAGVANIRKLAACLVVGKDGNLNGSVVDAIVIVGAGEGVETVGTTDDGPHGQPILHN